jgi:hypothetical protein
MWNFAKPFIVLALLLVTQAPESKLRADNGTASGQVQNLNGTPASGVRVAALVIPDPGQTANGGALASLAETDSTGHYRLENIPPGNYFIQAGLIDFPSYYPGVLTTTGATAVRITSGAAVTGLDFDLKRPPGVRISGHVPLGSNGTRATMLRLTGAGGSFQPATAQPNADGSFEFLRVPPGNYTLMVSPATVAPNLPLLVTDKDIDLGLPSGPGVKVSGTVGLGPQSPHSTNQKAVLLGASAWAQLQTGIDAVGKFEFASVPAGNYSVTTIPGPTEPLATLIVGSRDIAGLTLPAYLEVSGHVILADGSPFPALSPALMIGIKRANGTTLSTAVRPEGSFRLPLAEGEYRLVFDNLPSGFTVQSMIYGSHDLAKESLKFDGTTPLADIQVTLQMKR